LRTDQVLNNFCFKLLDIVQKLKIVFSEGNFGAFGGTYLFVLRAQLGTFFKPYGLN